MTEPESPGRTGHRRPQLSAVAVELAAIVAHADLAPTPFHRPEWHEVWLRHFRVAGDPAVVAFGIIDEEGRLEGPPAGWMTLALEGDGAAELGDPNVRDYAGPVATPGREAEVVSLAFEWLQEDFARRAHFWGLVADAPLTAALTAEAHVRGWTIRHQSETACPGLDLPASWDEYLATLSKHHRHELRRKLRNVEALGDVEYRTYGGRADVEARMPLVLDLMRRSREDKAAFLTPPMAAFMQDLAVTFAGADITRLGLLRINGEPVAATLCFDYRAVTYLYNSGYEPSLADASVGLVSKACAIRNAIERGQARFDFLRGNEPYKRRLGGVRRQVVRLECVRP